MAPLQPGTTVRIVGLVKAAQHNGKTGRVSAKAGPDGRIGVELGEGQTLACRRENLELVAATLPEGSQRTLSRDTTILNELDSSEDPGLLALYYHFRDKSFDCFNASEYTAQMLQYYDNEIAVTGIVPRRINGNEYFLVCLQYKEEELNSLCEVAFQCMRQFCGISMLVKKRCFTCHKPGAAMCKCHCACFCSKECETSASAEHTKLCKLVRASKPMLEEECLEVMDMAKM